MPYSRKRKAYSRRRGAAYGAGATRALNRVAQAMYMSTDQYKNARQSAAAKVAYRRALASAIPNYTDAQMASVIGAMQAKAPKSYDRLMQSLGGRAPTQAELIRLVGKGGYWGRRLGSWLGGLTGNNTIKSWAGSLGDKLGDYVADAVPYGNQIASVAQGIAHMSGHGAYQMGDAPDSAMQVGTFSTGDVERVNIKSREYLGAINGASNFTLSTLILNPGLLQTFPQLSKLAMHYEQYQMNGCVFWFHSTSGESTNSADTAIGEIMMANQPDSTEANPLNKQQMVRLDSAKQAKPSIDQLHGIECADAPIKFIRHGDPIEATQDANRFDLGKFHLAVEGCNAAVTRIGELWVTYDVDLIRSRDSRGQEVASYRGEGNGTAAALFSSLSLTYNSIGLTTSGNTITFPQFVNDGDYAITIIFIGSATSGTGFFNRTPAIAGVSNGSMIANFWNREEAAANVANNSDAVALGSYAVRINAPGSTQCTVTFDGTSQWPNTSNVTTGYVRLIVTRVPQGLWV